jgi:hypothetical protein
MSVPTGENASTLKEEEVAEATSRSPRKFKAWLVTWEWVGNHAKRDKKVATIFDSRLLPERVRSVVEVLYAQETYTMSEKIAAFVGNGKRNPYPAEFLRLDGVPWNGEIHCGHNPYLRARLVDDLTIERGLDGTESASWKDRYSARGARKKS